MHVERAGALRMDGRTMTGQCEICGQAVCNESCYPHIPGPLTLGDMVRKKSGSEWEGEVVGWYATELTPIGYAVESAHHAGSVQIYPAGALEKL